MKILLAEDDRSQAESIQTWLKMDGYQVDWVEHGHAALQAIRQSHYDCLLLDRGLPGASGDEILKTVRKQSNVPVILITARDRIQDRVQGLDLGANDYLVKPFSLEELSARVRAQLRQHSPIMPSILHWGDLSLDQEAKTLQQAGENRMLTAKEFQILQRLMQHPQHIVTREQLEELLYHWDDETGSNTIEVFIYQLRKKLGSQSIKTIRGFGYRMGDLT